MTLEQLYKHVNDFVGLDIKLKSKANNLPLFRKYYCLLAKMYTRVYNYNQIGGLVQLDHSSVTSCVKTLEGILEVDKDIVKQFEDLEKYVISKHFELIELQKKYTPKRNYKYLDYIITIEKQKTDIKKKYDKIRRLENHVKKLSKINKSILEIEVVTC